MRKRWTIPINVAACILLVFALWQNTSSADCVFEADETACDDGGCYGGTTYVQSHGGYDCVCSSGTDYAWCTEEDVGDCTTIYSCTQQNCEGNCTEIGSSSRQRCLS